MDSVAQNIFTKQGIVKEPVLQDKKILHIGSGSKVLTGATSIDVLKLPGVDVVHNLDIYPWPFEAESFDVIYGHSVIEHLGDLVRAMEEMHRLLRPGGRIVMAVPYFRSVDAFQDPTHKLFFTSATMNYFLDEKNKHSSFQYSDKLYKKIGLWYGWPQKSSNPLVNLFKAYISKYSKFYDSHLSLLFPVKILVWELEVIKK